MLSWGIIIIATLTVVNVFCRTLLGFSLASVEEVCQFSIVLVTFVGLSYGAAQGRHIRMTALYDEVPLGPRRWLRITICFSTSLLLFVLTWYALRYAGTAYALGTLAPVTQVPLWLVYLSAPLGLGLAALQYLLAGIQNLQSEQVYLAFGVPEAYSSVPPEGV